MNNTYNKRRQKTMETTSHCAARSFHPVGSEEIIRTIESLPNKKLVK